MNPEEMFIYHAIVGNKAIQKLITNCSSADLAEKIGKAMHGGDIVLSVRPATVVALAFMLLDKDVELHEAVFEASRQAISNLPNKRK